MHYDIFPSDLDYADGMLYITYNDVLCTNLRKRLIKLPTSFFILQVMHMVPSMNQAIWEVVEAMAMELEDMVVVNCTGELGRY